MRRSIYEELERDRRAARDASAAAERRAVELLRLQSDFAALRMRFALLRLEHTLVRKYRPDQPRVPAGDRDGGQWTNGGEGERDVDVTGSIEPSEDQDADVEARVILTGGGFTKDQLKMTVQDFVAQNCQARIHAVIPGEFYDMTIGEVQIEDRAGNARARTCIKVLKRPQYRK